MSKIPLDKYYTQDSLAEYCINKTYQILGDKWDRIIEPSAGAGAFLKFLPSTTLSYDIQPEIPNITKADYREIKLPYISRSLVIGNPPFGRANKLSVQFIKCSLAHSDFISFIQPISQLNQNRTMKDTELLYSEDLGVLKYAGKPVHCCLNIYHKCLGGHKQDFNIPQVVQFRHIFRTGKYKHPDAVLNKNWTFRVAAWGTIKLLQEGEQSPNQIVIMMKDPQSQIAKQIQKELLTCDYSSLLSCVSTPNLPAWRLKKWLSERLS